MTHECIRVTVLDNYYILSGILLYVARAKVGE